MKSPHDPEAVREHFLHFARHGAKGSSPSLLQWAYAVADQPELAEVIATLPKAKQQPNLVFAAAQLHGAIAGDADSLRHSLFGDWDNIAETILTHDTQTNEVARCAALLASVADISGPIALLELGCSAGLNLIPDRYSYRLADGRHLDPHDGESDVVIEVDVIGDVPFPERMPEVVWRRGIDLNPLRVNSQRDMKWLEQLVWPEHAERRYRLRNAIALARQCEVELVEGNAMKLWRGELDAVPVGVTPVIFHSAVLPYVPGGLREEFLEAITQQSPLRHDGLRWVFMESPELLPGGELRPSRHPDAAPRPFAIARDGKHFGYMHQHGQWLEWLT